MCCMSLWISAKLIIVAAWLLNHQLWLGISDSDTGGEGDDQAIIAKIQTQASELTVFPRETMTKDGGRERKSILSKSRTVIISY